MVIWLIGMSASGKTTIGKRLNSRLQESNEKWFFLDGDTFRNILGEDIGHTIEDRRKNAYRISRFCEYLNSQGINVLACVLSIFHDNQAYNKKYIKNYKEVFIDVEFEELIKRDNKELYTKALSGEIKNVVGVDIEFKPPYSPDLVINNNELNVDFDDMVKEIIEKFDIQISEQYQYTQKNLLISPEKYQYSRVEGESFFKKFFEERRKVIKYLSLRLEKLKQYYSVDVSLEENEYLSADNIVLISYLTYLLNTSEDKLLENKKKLLTILKRFEVSKKLHKTYDIIEIRKSSLEYDELLNYPLFSLVLQRLYNIDDNIQDRIVYLNAVLKTNDIIASICSEFILGKEIYYTIKALNGEAEIAKEYTC